MKCLALVEDSEGLLLRVVLVDIDKVVWVVGLEGRDVFLSGWEIYILPVEGSYLFSQIVGYSPLVLGGSRV